MTSVCKFMLNYQVKNTELESLSLLGFQWNDRLLTRSLLLQFLRQSLKFFTPDHEQKQAKCKRVGRNTLTHIFIGINNSSKINYYISASGKI